MPATEPVQDRIDVPEPPVIVVRSIVHDRLVELLVTVTATVPENPLTDATVIVEVALVARLTVALVGFPLIVKSSTVYVTSAECDRGPLVPATVTE